MPLVNKETHLIKRIGWLRAAVLGANDGILSTASLIVGVASASGDKGAVMVAGLAGLVASAMSMAAGDYVSVSSQADTEAADVAKETAELKAGPAGEMAELAAIYQGRGLSSPLALQVAQEMMAGDALAAHKRDELGITEEMAANPIQAGVVSAVTVTASSGSASSIELTNWPALLGWRTLCSDITSSSRTGQRTVPPRSCKRSAMSIVQDSIRLAT